MKQIVLYVEGEGEAEAMPILIKRLIAGQGTVFIDSNVFRVGEVGKLVKNDHALWKKKLLAGQKRKKFGGALLILDGDVKKVGGQNFCAASVARSLAAEARAVGAGVIFSVAVVFARQEFESWLIAGFDSLAGKSLPDGRKIAPEAKSAVSNPEEHPRNAKGWFSEVVEGGYKPTSDQADITKLVDLDLIRSRKLRSFRRLESALVGLISAIQKNEHIATPC